MKRTLARKVLACGAWGVVAPALAFTALMGFAHTSAGHPLLVRIMPLLKAAHVPGASCPFGYDVAMTPREKESARQAFAASHRGEGVVTARPALGFALDETTSADVTAWAAANHVDCKRPKSGYDLECSNVHASALPGAATRGPDAPQPMGVLSSVWMTFGAGDRLIALVAVRNDPSAGSIASSFEAVQHEIAKAGGHASATTGEPSAGYLSLGSLRQASAEYRFQNYYAMTRATNLGNAYFLSEEFRSL